MRVLKKKWFVIVLSSLLVCASIPSIAFAEKHTNESGKYTTKDEVIYGNLDANGKVKDMYVVNSFDIDDPGEIVDYGEYTAIRNLTDLSEIKQVNQDEVLFQGEDEFYYQGELENHPLPWDISITYLLDGKEMTPNELAGQSGSLDIQITTKANEEVNPSFFEHYLLQVSMTLDPTIFDQIKAPKGTEANAGKDKQLTFSVMPDQEEELIMSAEVTDLEMDPIEISAIPANIAIENPDIGDMTGDMDSLSSAISQLNSGIEELSSGITELNTGTTELNDGSAEYLSGINELNSSSDELVNGSNDIHQALDQISDAMQGDTDMPDLGDMGELPEGLREMAGGLRESAEGLNTLKDNYDTVYDNLDQAISDIPESTLGEQEIAALYGSNADDEVIDELVETYTAAQTVKQTYDAVKEGFDAVSGTLEQVSQPLNEMAEQVESIADGIESGMEGLDQMDALAELQDGLATLSSEYENFHDGLISYTDGVDSLATSYQELHEGIGELSEGTSELDSGTNELKEGSEELDSETSDMPNEMQEQVDELLEDYDNSDFEPVSFVSEDNEDVDVVQFVLQTENIEQDEPEAEVEEEEEDKGFWDRFLDLFR